MIEDNPYYCPLIFQGLYVEKVNNNQVKTAACCLNRPGPAVDEIDFEHDTYLQHQRQQVLQQQPPEGCAICYRVDSQGGKSARQLAMENFPKSTTLELHKLDYNVDPVCNARCIQCGSYYSSAWAAEDQLYGKASVRISNQTLRNNISQNVDVSQVNNLYFNGGEPLLSKEPLDILQKIDQQGNLKKLNLSLNTNGSIRPSDEMINLWKRCSSVVINFSIDATGTAFEYIRNPLSWNTVKENIQWLSEQNIPKIDIGVAYTIGIHNIDLVESTQDWFREQSKNWKNTAHFYVNPCVGTLALEYASTELKQVWMDLYPDLDALPESDWRRLARREMEKPNTAGGNSIWLSHLEMIDQRRNLNWQTSLPGLYSAYKKSLG
jgi:sulfatase maturation enzyme AslB (radical SAM superfamily)